MKLNLFPKTRNGKYVRLFRHFTTPGTIRKRLFIYFLIALIPPLLLLGSVTYIASTSTIQKYIVQSSSQIVDQVMLHLDLSIKNMKQDTLTTVGNPMIVNFLLLEPSDLYEIYIQSNQIKENLFNMLMYNRDNLEGVFLIGQKGLFLSTGTREEKYGIFDGGAIVSQLPWIGSLPADGTLLLTGVNLQTYASNLPVITLARRIVNPQNPSATLGIFWIDLSLAQFKEMFRNVTLGETGYLAIFDHSGNPIVLPESFSEGPQLYSELFQARDANPLRRISGRRMIITTRQSLETGWQIAAVVPFDEVAGAIIQTKYLTGFVVVICIGIALVLSFKFAGSITRPIERLEMMMREASKGYLDGVIPVENTDEVGQLTNTFNHMLKKIQSLIQDMYHSRLMRLEAESKQQQAELKALQAQINPHFLFNTLNTINSLAVLEGMETISEMVVALGDFFRYNMKTDELIVTLKEEMLQVERYMYIQKLRFGERLTLEVQIPKEYMTQNIIKFSLQPLVENACIHGLELKRGAKKGVIKVSAFRSNDELVLAVSDNGKGIEPEMLEGLNEYFRTGKGDLLTGHIGMANVFSRLKIHYGEQANMLVHSKLGEGTTVRITLPYQAQTQLDGGYQNII